MDERFLETLSSHLRNRGITLDRGLTSAEMSQIEHTYGIRFPEDLAQLLRFALPVSKDFPNWRNESEAVIRKWLQLPLDGICFDIEHNQFWLEIWGSKPQSLTESFEIAKYHVNKAPHLIPIYAHRFIPDDPHDKGNPVYSVVQTDIIYYGFDLAGYLKHEFLGVPLIVGTPEEPRPIEFWSDLVS